MSCPRCFYPDCKKVLVDAVLFMHDWCRQLDFAGPPVQYTSWRRQQIRRLDYAECWHFGVEIRRIGSSTWCRIAGFVPITDNLFMKRENLAVSSQYPPGPYVESFPCQLVFLVPPDALAYRKSYWTSPVHCPPPTSFSLFFPASSTSMITVVPSARRQWLPLAELSQPAQQSHICCFSLAP